MNIHVFLLLFISITTVTIYASEKPCIEDRLEKLAHEYREKANIAYSEHGNRGAKINQGYYMASDVRNCMQCLRYQSEQMSESTGYSLCVESKKQKLEDNINHLSSLVRRPQDLYITRGYQLAMLKEIQETIEKENEQNYSFFLNFSP